MYTIINKPLGIYTGYRFYVNCTGILGTLNVPTQQNDDIKYMGLIKFSKFEKNSIAASTFRIKYTSLGTSFTKLETE